MKRVLWLGNPLFASSLNRLPEPRTFEVRVETFHKPRVLSWRDITDIHGCEPDVLVFGDNSAPPSLLGLESYPCLTVFACVDSHIHTWYPLYAQAFDLCTVNLRDHLPRFLGPRLDASRVLWSPPFAWDEDAFVPAEKTLDMIFVGKDDPLLTPARSALLAALRQRFPGFACKTGNYRSMFPTARLVLNVAEQGDMNFRIFEALACRGCLLTPRIGHGLAELFTDGEELFLYDPDDFEGLCALVARLLADEDLRERVAAAGQAKVDALHRARNRAATFALWLAGQPARELLERRAREAKAIHAQVLKPLYLHWSQALVETPLAQVYLDAARKGPGLDADRKGPGQDADLPPPGGS